MSKNKTAKENARVEGNARNAAWRNLTYAEQRQRLQTDGHWWRDSKHTEMTRQAVKITANAEKYGWDKKPVDCQNFDQPKKVRRQTNEDSYLVESANS